MSEYPYPYHVYADDGHESAHKTEAAAIRAAKRATKVRGLKHWVVRCDRRGLTGGGHGTRVWPAFESEEVEP